MFGSKKKSMMTPPRPRMGCGAWALIAFGVLVVVLVVYDWITGTDWNQTGSDFWETAQTPLMIAAAVLVGVPLAVMAVWAAVLDSPQHVKNGAERRWIVTTAGWTAWAIAALLAAFWAAPAGLAVGAALWAPLMDRRGFAKRHQPVTMRDCWAAVFRLIRRQWIVATVVVLAVVAAYLVADCGGIEHADEVRLWAGAAVVAISIVTAAMIRRDVRRTADLRGLKPVVARHVLGIPDGRLGDLGWKVRGGPHPKLELGFKGVGAPLRAVGLAEEVWAEVDRRLGAHMPTFECTSLTDVGITLVGVSPDTEAGRMLAEETDGLVVELVSIDQEPPEATKTTGVLAPANEGDSNE